MIEFIMLVIPLVFVVFAFMGAYHAIKDDIEDHRLD